MTASPPIVVPYAKGFMGTQYRTVLSLHRNVGASTSALSLGDPAWDIWVGPLPFLLASSEDRPYIRESTPVRRERFDTSRDAGENSLDSRLWIRSWTSWHLGAGQLQAEPIELEADVARFRFSRSAGLSPWTPGQMSLLPKMVQEVSSGVNMVLGVPGRGILEARSNGVWLNGTQLYSAGAVTKIVAGGTYWAGISHTGTMIYGKYDGSDQGTVATLTGVRNLAYQKNRYWAVDGPNTLREVTDVKGTPPPAITFLGCNQIIDIDSGVAGVYVMTDEGLTNIHVISADEDGALTAPVNVATLPRGETGKLLYGYLGRYMAIGSSRGLRVADSGSGQSLPIGPLIIEMPSAPADVTADGNFLWVTTAGADIDTLGDGDVMRPGTYRLDLSRVVEENIAYGETAAARFPYATDQYADSATGVPVSLSTYQGRLLLVLSNGQRWATSPTKDLVDRGWMETGDITFVTSEPKTWQSLTADVIGGGHFGMEANTGAGWVPVTQTVLPAPLTFSANVDQIQHPPSQFINLRLSFSRDGEFSPVLRSVGLRSMPAAKRTRNIRLPLLAFDNEVDRNQSPIGYDGFSYDRVRDLELLEEKGLVIQVLDTRTDETLNCQIETITFNSFTPPDRALKNWGGYIELTLLAV